MIGQSCLSIGRMWESDREWPELQPPKPSKLLGEGGFFGERPIRGEAGEAEVYSNYHITSQKNKKKRGGIVAAGP